MKKSVKYIGFSVILIFLLIAIWTFLIEPRIIFVRNISIDLPKWHKEHESLKIAVLTDFHIGFGCMNQKRLKKIINLTNQQSPDVILLLGDYVNVSGKNERFIPLISEFNGFKAKHGVYAVLGNHESWNVRDKIKNTIKDAGITLLENDAHKLTIDNKSFWIAGIEDLTTGYPDLEYTMNLINDSENPVLLLSHNPDIFDKIDSKVDLVLSGHTHGGQIYLPFLVQFVTPSRFGKRFLRGHVVYNNNHFFISSGLGTTIIPARFLVPPEIIILNIK